jgi:hypothetical protein
MLRKTGSVRSLISRICDSPVAKIAGLASAVLTIILFVGSADRPFTKVTTNSAPVAFLATAGKSNVVASPSDSKQHSHFQSSSAPQSPNISGVRHDVHIRYGPAAASQAPRDSSANGSVPTSSLSSDSTVQISNGSQSPNVSNTGGNVDIQFDFPAVPNAGKLQEGTK